VKIKKPGNSESQGGGGLQAISGGDELCRTTEGCSSVPSMGGNLCPFPASGQYGFITASIIFPPANAAPAPAAQKSTQPIETEHITHSSPSNPAGAETAGCLLNSGRARPLELKTNDKNPCFFRGLASKHLLAAGKSPIVWVSDPAGREPCGLLLAMASMIVYNPAVQPRRHRTSVSGSNDFPCATRSCPEDKEPETEPVSHRLPIQTVLPFPAPGGVPCPKIACLPRCLPCRVATF
jgi:hypothetical protein